MGTMIDLDPFGGEDASMANSKEKKQALGRNAIYRTHKKQIHSYQD
jgi:hypothetical protein